MTEDDGPLVASAALLGSIGSAAHGGSREARASTLDSASAFSVLFFRWMSPLLVLGKERPLEEGDLPDMPAGCRVEDALPAWSDAWPRALARDRARGRESYLTIVRALLAAFGPRFYVAAALHLAASTLQTVQPLLIRGLLEFLDDPDAPEWEGYAYGLSVAGAALLISALINNMFYNISLFGVRARSSLTASVYTKTMRLSAAALSGGGPRADNLAASDVERVFQASIIVNFLWIAPLVIVLVLALLVLEVGALPGLAGVLLMLAVVPLQSVFGRATGRARRQALGETDARVRVTGEVLSGIRMVKMYAWEDPFEAALGEVRAREAGHLRSTLVFKSFNLAVSYVWLIVVSLAVFSTYSLEGNTLDVPTVFSVLALLNALRFPLALWPMALSAAVEARVSLQRLLAYFGMEEVEGGAAAAAPEVARGSKGEGRRDAGNNAAAATAGAAADDDDDGDAAVDIRGASFAWGSDAEPALRDVTLRVPRGALVAVIGSVGSGKSTLLSSVLGETRRLGGRSRVRGSVAYTAQTPFLRSASLRNNVTFGLPTVAGRYERAVRAAALGPDLDILPDRDETEIGEKGLNVSGGQKARICLARAVYRASHRTSDHVVLLDDPLSAVDVHVGAHIFTECIEGELAGSTRVVVLNSHLQYLPRFDSIVVVEGGRVVAHGTYDELHERYAGIMNSASDDEEDDEEGGEADGGEGAGGGRRSSAAGAPRRSRSGSNAAAAAAATPAAAAAKKPPAALVQKEERKRGAVGLGTVVQWVAASSSGRGGYGTAASVAASFALAQVLRVLSEFWLASWARNDEDDTRSQSTWIGVFAGLAAATVAGAALRSWLFTGMAWRASIALHARALRRLLHAPTSYFDTTPQGRMLNLVSGDLDRTDSQLPDFAQQLLQNVLFLFSSLVVVCVTSPWLVVLVFPGAWVFSAITSYFRRSSRELKRLDNLSRSPLLSLFGESVAGLATIRAYRMTPVFEEHSRELVARNARAHFYHWMSNRWLAVRLDLIAAALITAVALAVVALRDDVRPEFAGLAMISALSFTGLLQWSVRLAIQVEDSLTSVERLVACADEVPQEAAYRGEPWSPAGGRIELRDLRMRYRPGLPLVLRGVTLDVPSGATVGVVGRTGAGKSSLAAALLRLTEPESAGSVLIDGRDAAGLGLLQLRSQVAVIPQDPVLFSGTLRSNLDPFGEHPDEALLRALDQVGLGAAAREGGGLASPVAERGGNYSEGQRQLLCIARAVLKDARIIIMDEATSSIDVVSDAAIQRVMRDTFAGKTTLVIAHRLETIAHADRILVMGDGRVLEYDAPLDLLARRDSHFFRMVGPAAAAALRRAALGEITDEELRSEAGQVFGEEEDEEEEDGGDCERGRTTEV